jgi:hypothetical protein
MPDIEEGPSVKHSKGPPALTLYPASTVKGHGANDVGIYFPEAYIPSANLDLLVYFHGLPTPCGGSNSDTIRDIWRSSTFQLREMVNKSKKNVVLVAPRLNLDGGLKLDMDADDFLKKIVGFIAARVTKDPFKWHGAAPADGKTNDPVIKIRTLILAAHSGGGTPMLRFAQGATIAKVRECWGFDSMYGSSSAWVDWAAAGGKYFLFWTAEGAINSDKYGNNVTKMQNILAKANGVGSGIAYTIAHAVANGMEQAKAGSHAKQEQVRKAQEKRDHEATRAALAAPNITITYAPKPGDTAKGFTPKGGATFKSSTSEHCQVPTTYWGDVMSSF